MSTCANDSVSRVNIFIHLEESFEEIEGVIYVCLACLLPLPFFYLMIVLQGRVRLCMSCILVLEVLSSM